VGWDRRGETQQMPVNVGFRSSTQPTVKSLLSSLCVLCASAVHKKSIIKGAAALRPYGGSIKCHNLPNNYLEQ
jgi:hypothetical protein